MSAYVGRTLSWNVRDDALEVALHRLPCNEIGSESLTELEHLVRFLEDGAGDARVVLLHSTVPSGFCAGADLRELHAELMARRDRRIGALRQIRDGVRDLVGDRGQRVERWARDGLRRAAEPAIRREIRRFIDRIHAVFDALDTLPMPVIAAVHGPVFGGGLELALTADVIVADKSARFCFPELRLGIIPGFGGIPRLTREVGNAVARDLLLTGRSLGARRAHEVGLVAHLVGRGEALGVARRVAAQAARFDPVAVAAAKSLLKTVPTAALEREKDLFCQLVARPGVVDALTRFVESDDVMPYLP